MEEKKAATEVLLEEMGVQRAGAGKLELDGFGRKYVLQQSEATPKLDENWSLSDAHQPKGYSVRDSY